MARSAVIQVLVGLRARAVLLVWLVGVVVAPPAVAQPLRIAIDGSGSMRGWAATGGLHALVADLLAASEAAGFEGSAKVFYAGSTDGVEDTRARWADWAQWHRAPVWGQTTLLDDALRTATQGARAVVLITDNFQDPFGTGGGSAGTTEAFYRTLGSLELHRVWLAPLLARFDGNVDLAAGGLVPAGPQGGPGLRARLQADTALAHRAGGDIGRPHWHGGAAGFWKVPYRGHRALAVYLVLNHSADAVAFARFRAALTQRHPALTPLLVKPLGADALRVRPASGAANPEAIRCGGPPLWPTTGTTALSLHTGAEGPELRAVGATLDPRQPGKAIARVELVGAEAHIGVSGALGDCSGAARVGLTGLAFVPTSGAAELLRADAAARASVSPAHVLGALDPSSTAPRTLQLQLELPPLVGSDVSRVRAGAAVRGQLELVVRVPRAALRLSAATRQRLFTRVPTDLARLYSPRDIVQALAEGPIEIRLPMRLSPSIWAAPPVVVPPTTPPWAWLWAVLPLLGLLGVRPYGFVAPVRVGTSRYVHSVRVGGLLARARVAELALPDGTMVRIHRRGLGRRLYIAEHGTIRRGHSLEIADTRLEWLGRRDTRRAIEAGDWDQAAG